MIPDFGLSVNPGELMSPATYITSESTISFTITNLTTKKIRFQWRSLESKDAEEKELQSIDVYDPGVRRNGNKLFAYQSDVFIFDEIEGELWPKTSTNHVIKFKPTHAGLIEDFAYLTDVETGERIKVKLLGECLPPLAAFSTKVINVEHIMLDNSYEYRTYLVNVGKAPLQFSLVERKTNLKFEFLPSKGSIDVGCRQEIIIKLYAVKVGQFNEMFLFKINGTEENFPRISICGRVIGPTFKTDAKELQYGNVSLGFLYKKTFNITNTSDIPFDFEININKGENIQDREMTFYPNIGVIEPRKTTTITVELIPVTVQHYAANLLISNPKFSESLMDIPIAADCDYPVLGLENNFIDAGDLFFGHTYQFQLVMVNKTRLSAKYEYIDKIDQEDYGLELDSNQKNGIVDPLSSRVFPFTIKLTQLGNHSITRKIVISGIQSNVLEFGFKASCIGPTIDISTTELNFGETKVLVPKTLPITITNTSLIDAEYTVSFQEETSVFKFDKESDVLEPGETKTLNITTTLDDVAQFDATLQLLFKHLSPINIKLRAKGVGIFVVPSIPLGEIELGHLFVNDELRKEFVLDNQGRKPLEIRWVLQKPKVNPEAKTFSYTIEPDHGVVEAHEKISFAFVVNSATPCKFDITPQCTTTIKKQRVDLFAPHFSGEFCRASLQIEKPKLEFTYVHDGQKEEEQQNMKHDNEKTPVPSKELMHSLTQENSFINSSPMPFTVTTIQNPPFIVSEDHFELNPGDRKHFTVTFDPRFKNDFVSETIEKKICFKSENNQQEYFLEAKGTIIFPNLKFSSTLIDFGVISASAESSQTVKIQNPYNIKIEYLWEFLADNNKERTFDVIPIRGTIEPNSEENAYFTFYGSNKDGKAQKCVGTAVCHVTGGPDYLINLKGTTTSYNYSLEPKVINLGSRSATDQLSTSVVLRNKGELPISFAILKPKTFDFTEFSIDPMKGTINKGEQQTFKISIITGYIKNFREFFSIKIGQFDEERVDIMVSTYYPRIAFSIPRVEDDRVVSAAKGNTEEQYDIAEQKIISDRLRELFRRPSFVTRVKTSDAFPIPKIFNGMTISVFELDMESLMLGNDYTKTFDLKFVGVKKGSFDFLDQALKDTGFSFQENQFRNVTPGEIIPVTVNFSSSERKLTECGECSYDIPVVLNDEFGYLVKIKTVINSPMISISDKFINFENVIIGKTKIITVQLQNMNNVACEYTIKPAEQTNAIRRSVKSLQTNAVFITTPTQGVLPPASFQNIEISFTPIVEKTYSMQIPIYVKYNNQCTYLTLKGNGVQLKLNFSPEVLNFKMTQSFCEPEVLPVQLINPTQYPIEVYSKQFDGKLTLQSTEGNVVIQESPQDEASRLAATEARTFSICTVVHGPPKSGKTELSMEISKYLGDIPIIDLAKVWENIPQHSKPQDYIDELKKVISDEEYANGFVVDGLCGIPEPPETEAFLTHSLKNKTISEELQNDPLLIIPHKEQTAAELCLSYLKEALGGHYLFLVSINATEQQIATRMENAEKEKKKREMEKARKELDGIFSMTEAEYNALSDEEKENVDKKREDYRNKLISEERAPPVKAENQSSSKSVKKAPKKPALPTDPNVLNTMIFLYTQGSIINEALKQGANCKIIDIDHFFGRVKDEPKAGNDVPSSITSTPKGKKSSKLIEPEKAPPKLMELMTQSKLSMRTKNVLLIQGVCTIEEQSEEMKKFLPSINEFKERTFALMISPSRSIVEKEMTRPSLSCSVQPKVFTIVQESAPSEHKVEINPETGEEEEYLEVSKPILAPRWYIDPGQSVTINVAFNAMEPGHFETDFTFGILNANTPPFKLHMKGDCVCPDIERAASKIFPKIVPSLAPKMESAFVSSLNEFHFGSVIVVQAKSPKASQAFYKQQLHLINPTPFDAEVQCLFSDAAPKNVWLLDQSTVVVPANGSADVLVGFNPQSPDVFRNTLYFNIKDNPESLSFTFVGEGCAPVIESTTENVDYDKLLVKQEKTMKIDLKNTGKIPAFWRIKGGNVLGPTFSFSALEGILLPRKSTFIEVKYSSPKTFSIKKTIQIDVMDKTKLRTFSALHVNFSAETFDANFELVFPKGVENVNFGDVKINKSGTFQLGIKSHSKYPLMYKFVIAKASIRNCMKIDPMEGGIQPDGKPVNINFTFQANNQVSCENAKGISLKVTDSVSGTEIANVPVPYSAKIVVSKYNLTPESSIDFGPVVVSSHHSKNFTLVNTGSFPFEYELVSLTAEAPVEPETPRTNNPRDKKKALPKKEPVNPKAKKGKLQNALVIGDFTISPNTGLINPGETAQITAEVTPTRTNELSAKFVIKLTDGAPEIANGIPYTLSTTAFKPAIDIEKIDQMFPGLEMLVKADLAKKDINCIVLPEKSIRFANLIVGKSSTIDLRLTNVNPIPCTVDLAFKGQTKAFTVSKKSIEIQPNSAETLQIKFSPKEAATYTSKLEISVRNGESTSFDFEGSSGIPEIEVSYQNNPIEDAIKFGQVLVGSKKTKEITITNVGILDAPVVINADANPDFEIHCETNITIQRKSSIKIPVTFQPEKVRHGELDMQISVPQNNDAKYAVSFVGDGNSEEILFIGLPNDESDLFFKDAIVGSQQKITFKMRSVSQSAIKYSWSSLPDFTFIPKVGHIKPGQTKVVTVIFSADHAVRYDGIKAALTVQKIVLDDPECPDWDDSMKEKKTMTRRLVFLNTPAPPAGEPKSTGRKFPAHGRKVKEPKKQQQPELDPILSVPLTEENADDLLTIIDVQPEPSFTPEKDKRDIILRVFAAADIIKYTLDTTNVEFRPAMMFQKVQVPVTMTNPSQIGFNFHWFTYNFQSLHGEYSTTLPSPFNMIPADGTIKAGQTINFLCEFNPQEVDEFSGKLRCEIPFLTQMPPPEISVTGMSRRPICHINVDASDYITSGRRLPEFTESLPPDVRVVEISSKRIGERVVKRIEIINTTSNPYEFNWTKQYESTKDIISCETPSGLISSGKKFQVIFSYKPNSPKVVESLWTFSIPVFNVKAPVLIIGKVNQP